MSNKHTPGLWRLEYDNQMKPCVKSGEYWIATIHSFAPCGDGSNGDSARHNACLIAAAPDLLDVCDQLVYAVSWDDEEELENAISSARAAIAKAKGTQ